MIEIRITAYCHRRLPLNKRHKTYLFSNIALAMALAILDNFIVIAFHLLLCIGSSPIETEIVWNAGAAFR